MTIGLKIVRAGTERHGLRHIAGGGLIARRYMTMGKGENVRGAKGASGDLVKAMLGEILAELRRAKARDMTIMRKLHVIELHSAGEALPDRPWQLTLSEAKAEQVDRVCDYLKAHPTASINVACKKAWHIAKGGYTLAGLLDRCYKLNIPKFAKVERNRDNMVTAEEARATARL